MSLFTRTFALACSLVIALGMGALLSACGDGGVAATWAHGEIEEKDVTTAIENAKSNLENYYEQMGLTDTSSLWETYITDRQYDESASDDDEDDEQASSDSSATSKKAKKSSSKKSKSNKSKKSSKSKDSDETDSSDTGSGDADDSETSDEDADEQDAQGTVADLRAYYIRQLAETDMEIWQAEQDGLEVSQEDIDAQVEAAREQIESQYMPGTFESVLQLYGYEDLEAYEDSLKDDLLIEKLQDEQVGGHEDVTGLGVSASDDFDEDAWDEYVDGLVDSMDLQIRDMPAERPYDPAVIAAESSSQEDEDAENEDTTDEDAENEDATDEDATSESTDDSSE